MSCRILTIQRKVYKDHQDNDHDRHIDSIDTVKYINSIHSLFDYTKPYMLEMLLPIYLKMKMMDKFVDVLCGMINSISHDMRHMNVTLYTHDIDNDVNIIESIILYDDTYDHKDVSFDYTSDRYYIVKNRYVDMIRYLLHVLSIVNVTY